MKSSVNLDLRIGDPLFIEEYWKTVQLPTPPTQSMSYTVARNHDDLKAAILKLHSCVGNIDITNKHVVIGNGATQLLTALIYCMGNKVYFEAPHYYKFPDFCKITGQKQSNYSFLNRTIIKTIPNNPDHELDVVEPLMSNIIYDMCYYWPTYLPFKVQANPQIAVFSSAKALGNCSSRIGWALIEDKELADKVIEYIETNVGGISVEAKQKTITLIDHVLQNNDFFHKMNLTLRARWHKLDLVATKDFEVVNTFGLYAWCRGKCPVNILSLKGSLFGVSDNFFRLNLGCSSENFETLIKVLEDECG